MNQNPEQIARDKIDQMLIESGWLVQSKDKVNLSAGIGVALRETNTESGSADYILFVHSKAVGVIEAKDRDQPQPDSRQRTYSRRNLFRLFGNRAIVARAGHRHGNGLQWQTTT